MADYQQKRDFMKKFFKTIIPIIVIAVALILFLNWANKTEKYECEIEEIQSGIYARYQSTACKYEKSTNIKELLAFCTHCKRAYSHEEDREIHEDRYEVEESEG